MGHNICLRVIKRSAFCVTLTVGAYCANGFAAWLPALSFDAVQTISEAALQRAQSVASLQQRSVVGGRGQHPLGVQVLFVEAKEQKKKGSSNGLQAEVFLFDYSQTQTSVELVDANTGQLISTTLLDSVQLPLNAVEADFATQLLRDNSNFFDRLAVEYQQQFAQALVDESAIDMKVSVWVPDTRVYTETPCVVSRCALVSVFTNQQYNFSIEPVVDLVSGKVYLDLLQ